MATERFVSSAQTRKAIQRLRKERQKLNQPAPPLPPVQGEEAGSGRSQSGDLLNSSAEGSPGINLTTGGDAENCSNNENQSSLIEKNVSDSNVNESSLQIDRMVRIEGMIADFHSERNIFVWDAYIQAPENCSFEYGVFKVQIKFPNSYPMSPPRIKFIKPVIFHPNVYPDGTVCISILHSPGEDPFQYEKACERWTPSYGIDKVLLCIANLLAEPNIESPANVDAAKMYRDDRERFDKIADKSVRLSLGLL